MEERRAKIFCQLHGLKYLSASRPLGSGPEVCSFKWNVEESVKEYESLLKKKQGKQRDLERARRRKA